MICPKFDLVVLKKKIKKVKVSRWKNRWTTNNRPLEKLTSALVSKQFM
jgi:hypothetical protein